MPDPDSLTVELYLKRAYLASQANFFTATATSLRSSLESLPISGWRSSTRDMTCVEYTASGSVTMPRNAMVDKAILAHHGKPVKCKHAHYKNCIVAILLELLSSEDGRRLPIMTGSLKTVAHANPLTLWTEPVLVMYVWVWVHLLVDPQSVQLKNATALELILILIVILSLCTEATWAAYIPQFRAGAHHNVCNNCTKNETIKV